MAVAAAVATGDSGPEAAAAEEGWRLRGQVDAAARVALLQALTVAVGARCQAVQLATRDVAAAHAAGAKSLVHGHERQPLLTSVLSAACCKSGAVHPQLNMYQVQRCVRQPYARKPDLMGARTAAGAAAAGSSRCHMVPPAAAERG